MESVEDEEVEVSRSGEAEYVERDRHENHERLECEHEYTLPACHIVFTPPFHTGEREGDATVFE